MNTTVIIGICVCIIICLLAMLAAVIAACRLREKKLLRRLQEMLEDAVAGTFSEGKLMDTGISELESAMWRFLNDSQLSSVQLAEQKQRIQSLISDISHQTVTPIANIKMYSEFLREDSLTTEEYRHFADNLDRQARKLSWLGEGFAKISRMETGIISLKPEIQPVLPVILEAVDQAALKAEQHGNDIRLKGDQKLKACLDRRWTEEVFFNLLDNAVKYSDPGSVILVELLEYEMYIRINVCSRGTKVKREEFARVFQRFYRGKNAEDQEGVGLGLYLAREIIRGQRGYMKGEYDPEKGNVFSVFLCR